MSHQQVQAVQNFWDEDEDNEDIRSMEGSILWSEEEENIAGYGNAKQKDESNTKIAMLEANNKILKGKLENLEGKLQNLGLKAQIRAMTEKANLNKLKKENITIRARMQAAEEKAQMAKNEFEANFQEMQKKMAESFQEMAIQTCEQLKAHKQDLEAKNLKEMADLKKMLKNQGINLEQIKSAISGTDLIKGKKIENRKSNRWINKKGIQVSEDGLNATIAKGPWRYVFAEEEYCLSVADCRKDNLAGIIIYYFEVTNMSSNPSERIGIGLSNGNIPDISSATNSPNCYTIWAGDDYCILAGRLDYFKRQTGANKPKWNGQGDVTGCGILISPTNKVSIFFTLNGILLGKKIPLEHPGDSLCPIVRMCDASIEANFGDDAAKPFRYNIDKCPGLDAE